MSHFIPHTPQDVQEMLDVIGVKAIDDLFGDILPHHAPRSFDLPEGKSEWEVERYFQELARKNRTDLALFIGGGYYDHYFPAAIDYLASRGEFLTAYTPYQPECAQGTLQALYEFQSSICALTGMDVANASLYDGGTALYEAMMMAVRATGRKKIVMDGGVNPIYRTLIRSYSSNLDIEFVETPVVHGQSDRQGISEVMDSQTAAVILQNPNFFGAIDDHQDIITLAQGTGALSIECVYPVSLGLVNTPGDMGADIVTGDCQSLGMPLSFGGPYGGFMAARKKLIRQMPGRIVGQTFDRDGRRCFVNTLQAREQHIRREKATSNICTNMALCAIRATMFLSLLGKEGLRELASLNLHKAEFARQQLEKVPGVQVKRSAPVFNEFTVCLPYPAAPVIEKMLDRGFAAGFPVGRYYKDMEKYMIVAVTEKRTREEIENYARCLSEVLITMEKEWI